MAYGKNQNNVKQSNVNYLSRDFNDLKSSLINYAKSYFPNTYKDFNETSPGMMLLEMSAYVGDVLNFYIDQQYKELMLPLAEDKKNLLTLAQGVGYKVKAASPAYAKLQFTQTIGADALTGKPQYNAATILPAGMGVTSNTNSELVFETLDVIDFTTSSSLDPVIEVSDVDGTTGVPSQYKLVRSVKAVSGKTQQLSFNIGEPQKFRKINLPAGNVIEILKVEDSNANIWYEVESLAKDKVPYERHYTSDQSRTTGYIGPDGYPMPLPVPYSLEFIKTTKRFITEVNEDNTTSLIFGNGVLKNGNSFGSTFLAVEQVGINLPGSEKNLETSIDPLMGDAYGTLGEAPAHTTLTVTYRVGGGSEANTPANSLTIPSSVTTLNGIPASNVGVINPEPASGGTAGETHEELRHRAISHISTQNRCVTKQDYEARTLNMPSKFGNIAKVYCQRSGAIRTAQRKKISGLVTRLQDIVQLNVDMFNPNLSTGELTGIHTQIKNKLDVDDNDVITAEDFGVMKEIVELAENNLAGDDRLYTIDLYILSYDTGKRLIKPPTIIKQNLKAYLDEYRLLTDQINFHTGYVVNFGVVFDVVAMTYENKEEVKLKCIDAIKNYFHIDKMQFKQVLYSSDVETLLMDVDGVRAVNYVTLTQDRDYNTSVEGDENVFQPPLYGTAINSDGTTVTTSNTNFGYYYDFSKFYGPGALAGKGIILPAYEPSVFELKNPNTNIKGIVR